MVGSRAASRVRRVRVSASRVLYEFTNTQSKVQAIRLAHSRFNQLFTALRFTRDEHTASLRNTRGAQRPVRVPKPLRAVVRDLISASGTGWSSRWLVFGL